MMKSGRVMATALCALGTTSAFTGPLAGAFRASKGVARHAARNAGRSMQMAVVAEGFELKVKGEENTMDYRAFFIQGGKEISPWHDIPLKAETPDTFNYVCEIPKYGLAKMEIATKEPLNPIAQDTKKGKLRFYHGPIFWNYGYIPQTWEDPGVKHPELDVLGDGDPVDVVEIGSAKLASGAVKAVKPLGCLAMIDDGELDWKVIAIDLDDPLAKELHDIEDVEKLCPGYVSGIREWFRWYKTPDDKPLNNFGFGEKALGKADTLKVIDECNGHWRNLYEGKTDAGKMWLRDVPATTVMEPLQNSMHHSRHSMGKPKVTVRYAGGLRDGRDVNGNLSLDSGERAAFTRRHHLQFAHDKTATLGAHVTASLHTVPRWSAQVPNPEVNSVTEAERLQENAAMLLRAVQTDFSSAPVTALPAGIHMMCHVGPYSTAHTGPAASPVGEQSSIRVASMLREWSALWEDLWADANEYSKAEHLEWKRSCLGLLKEAAIVLGVAEVASVGEGVSGWALVPCESSSPLCLLASGGDSAPGNVMWFHLVTEGAEAAASALTHRLLALTDEDTEPTFASVLARVAEDNQVAITAEAHSVLPLAALSGYDVDPATYAGNNPRTSTNVGTDDERTDIDQLDFIDDSSLPDVVGGRWFGTSTTEELPGGGLHRRVRAKIFLNCKGEGHCWEGPDAIEDSEHQWCTILLTQHVSQGAYIDIDEVKARHNFDVVASVPTRGKVMVETFGGQPIDVELPASVSSQHVVNFNFRVGLPRNEGAVERAPDVYAELTLPVHLRYPNPACQHRGEDCDYYASVEVPPPLVGIRCGVGGSGTFVPVLPTKPPTPVVLRVPRGILWHRNFVVWGTIGAAALGMLYTMYTLRMLSEETIGDASRKRTAKIHLE